MKNSGYNDRCIKKLEDGMIPDLEGTTLWDAVFTSIELLSKEKINDTYRDLWNISVKGSSLQKAVAEFGIEVILFHLDNELYWLHHR